MQDETMKLNPNEPESTAAEIAPSVPDLPVIGAEPQAEEDSNVLPAEFLERRKKAKRKRLVKIGLAAAIVACIGIGSGIFLLSNGSDAAEQTGGTGTYTERVTVGDLNLTVEGSGSLSAKSTASVSPSVSGTVKKIYVSEGDEVKEGDTLFTMTSEDLDDALEEASDALGEAADSLEDAEDAYTEAKSSASSSSTSSSSNSSSSSGNSNKKSNSSSSSSSSSSSKKSSGSSSSANSSADNSGNSAPSASDGGTSESSLAVESATASQASYSLTNATTMTVSSASDTSNDAVSQAKSTLQQAQSNYNQAYKAYQKAVAALDDLTVKAESDGTVTAINISEGDTVGSGGSSAGASSSSGSTAAMTISDYSKMTVTMQVSEYDISNIEKGQKATVTVTALDKTCKAKVTSVSATASTSSSSGNSSSSTAYYDVVLTISKPTDDMKEGMSATIELAYESFEDALLVSTGAIFTSPDGMSYVTVQNGEQTTQVQVEVLGGSDDKSAVTGDLNEGDTVVVTYQISSSDNAASSDSNNSDMGRMMGEMSGTGNSGNRGPNGNGSGGGPGGDMPSGGPGGNN